MSIQTAEIIQYILYGLVLLIFVPILKMLIDNIKKMKAFQRDKKAREITDKLLAGDELNKLIACDLTEYIWDKVRIGEFNRNQLNCLIKRALQLEEEHKTKEHEYSTVCAMIERLTTNGTGSDKDRDKNNSGASGDDGKM